MPRCLGGRGGTPFPNTIWIFKVIFFTTVIKLDHKLSCQMKPEVGFLQRAQLRCSCFKGAGHCLAALRPRAQHLVMEKIWWNRVLEWWWKFVLRISWDGNAEMENPMAVKSSNYLEKYYGNLKMEVVGWKCWNENVEMENPMEPVEVLEPSDKSFPTSPACRVGCSLHLPT